MNKRRVEAFTDAIIAIIATIMVLELKPPLTSRFDGLISELPHLFAFTTSFFFILVAWYNHHYIFSLAERISKRTYWFNNLWLFSTSLIPFSTTWVGRYIDHLIPEYFYFLIFLIWSTSFVFLAESIAKDLKQNNLIKAKKIENMTAHRFYISWHIIPYYIIVLTLAFFFPPTIIIMNVLELIFMAISTPIGSDDLD